MTTPLMPGSCGEHDLQERYGNRKRAEAFYKHQMLTYLKPADAHLHRPPGNTQLTHRTLGARREKHAALRFTGE